MNNFRFSPLMRLAEQREVGLVVLIVLTLLAVTLRNPDFLHIQNLIDILIINAPVAIVACGLTLVIVTGEIDISMGSLMAVLAASIGLLTSAQHADLPVVIGVLLILSLGTAVGFFNGLLVTYGRVPSIIVTLGMLTALRGVNELLMGGEWIMNLPDGLRFLGIGTFFGIPVPLIVAGIVIAATIILARQMALGRRIYAVGSNREAARLAGVSEKRIKLFVFALTGFLTAVATLISVPQLDVIDTGIGVGFELLAVTCVVVGGTSISGGKGTIIGAMLGVLLLGMIRTVLVFLQLGEMATYWERAIQGAFILIAVLVDHLARARGGGE